MRLMSRAVLMAVVAVTFAACASAPPKMPSGPTLYQRLGGRDALKGVVDDFVANVVADPRVSGRFKGLQPAAVSKLQTNLADQICDATGGPCAYLGRDMKTTHAGMGITDAEWSATVEDLVKSLNKFNVPVKDQQELLAILGPMKKDIVGQ
jgi:hemoglobin